MSNWLNDTLNGFLAKIGLPAQAWHHSANLTLQFDEDITCEMSLLDDSILVSFLTPVFASSQTRVLQHLCQKNPITSQQVNHFRYHWYNNQAVIQSQLSHESVTEIVLEQVFTALLTESQTIKAM